MNIIGLDVGKNYAVLCCLIEEPVNIQQYFKEHRSSFEKLPTNIVGVRKLLGFKPNAIVLEPSGHWYSHFWYRVAVQNEIEVFWVGHADLDKQRGSYGFKNKRDEEDALCLAATYFDSRFIDRHGNKRFLDYYHQETISSLRELFLAKEQLAKLRSNLIAQIKQRLSYEFPEIAGKNFKISSLQGFTPIIGWLAGINNQRRYDNLYRNSIAPELNITISQYTRDHARTLVDIEQRITNHYEQLTVILAAEQFIPYHRVFDSFGFGLDNRALLLAYIYPIERFLVNDKCWIEWEESRGKMQKRDRSLRKFQSYIGLSYKIAQSGDKTSRSFNGSSSIRAHLYAWAVCQIAPSKLGYRVKTDIGKQLSSRYQIMRNEMKVKGKDALIRILFKASRMLFYELVNAIY
jgi:hypothetical protein